MKIVSSAEDLRDIYPGRVVSLRHNAHQLFTVIDTREIYTEDGNVPNPVTLVTSGNDGRPYIVTVCAYALSLVTI